MLVNKQNANILPLAREAIERLLNRMCFRLGIDNKKVLLRVWRVGNVLFSVNASSLRWTQFWLGRRTPMPARRRPVTESCQSISMNQTGENHLTYLIAYDGEELPVFVGGRVRHSCVGR